MRKWAETPLQGIDLKLKAKLKLEDLKSLTNVATKLSEDDLSAIGHHVVETFEIDKQSRSKWETKMKAANDLALQIVKDKQYPWENASNVKFPLLTIACLQFASRAYPALVKVPDLVKFRVQGRDEQGLKAARAGRISSHMSWQLLDQDEHWEEEQDKAFIALPILGCIFKESYYDPIKGHNCSDTILPMDLVVHYYAKSLDDCARKTKIFQLYERSITERVLKNLYLKHDLSPAPVGEPAAADERRHGHLELVGPGFHGPRPARLQRAL